MKRIAALSDNIESRQNVIAASYELDSDLDNISVSDLHGKIEKVLKFNLVCPQMLEVETNGVRSHLKLRNISALYQRIQNQYEKLAGGFYRILP